MANMLTNRTSCSSSDTGLGIADFAANALHSPVPQTSETQHIELLPGFQYTAVKKTGQITWKIICVSVKGGQGRLCLFLINALQTYIAFQNSCEFQCSFAQKLLHFFSYVFVLCGFLFRSLEQQKLLSR